MNKHIFHSGFSKLTNTDKRELVSELFESKEHVKKMLNSFLHPDKEVQHLINEISENVISNYHIPFSIAPQVKINGKIYTIPLVIEESSVVAAVSKAAKIWNKLGGFHARVISATKHGHVHFLYHDEPKYLEKLLPEIKSSIYSETAVITEGMRKRGGGITDIKIINKTEEIPYYYKLELSFNTADAMGANFINTCLEKSAKVLKNTIDKHSSSYDSQLEIIMSILSNHYPECLVESYVECDVNDLEQLFPDLSADEYSRKFEMAVKISKADISRAVTHNKGIFNGIDAVAMATGNDYRAIEASGHAYASSQGRYSGLSEVYLDQNRFKLLIRLPMPVGTVGGLTNNHPLAKLSLQLLNDPSSDELMMILATIGLASNFSAIHALITTGIQKGHMKMHLSNIYTQLNVTEKEKSQIEKQINGEVVSMQLIKSIVEKLRS